MAEKFFILGSQRSGTTLMRLILDSHPDILCLDETESYEVLLGKKPMPDTSPYLGFKVPVWTQHFPDNPPYYNGEKIIFMLRPVEDTVASMLNLELGGVKWTDSWLKPAMSNKQEDSKYRQKYARELKLAGNNLAGLAALFWKEKTQTLERLPDAHAVQYNRLVSAPTTILRGVCTYLGVEWNANLLKHDQLEHRGVYADGTSVGGTVVNRAIDKASVGRGKSLSAEDLELIAAIANDNHS